MRYFVDGFAAAGDSARRGMVGVTPQELSIVRRRKSVTNWEGCLRRTMSPSRIMCRGRGE